MDKTDIEMQPLVPAIAPSVYQTYCNDNDNVVQMLQLQQQQEPQPIANTIVTKYYTCLLLIGIGVWCSVFAHISMITLDDNNTITVDGLYEGCNMTSMKSMWAYVVNNTIYLCNHDNCADVDNVFREITYNVHNHLCVEQYGYEHTESHWLNNLKLVGFVCIAIGILCAIIRAMWRQQTENN